jgi:AraC-like DNA-binding protein
MQIRVGLVLFTRLLVSVAFLVVQVSSAQPADSMRIEELLSRSRNYVLTNADSSRALALRAAEEALRIRQYELYSKAMNLVGISYYQQGKLHSAKKSYLDALDALNRTMGGIQSAYNLRHNLGKALVNQGDYLRGLDNLNQSLQIAINMNDQEKIALSLFSISQVYYDFNEFGQATKFLKSALETSLKSGNKLRQAQIYNEMGNINYSQKQFGEALLYYQKTLKLNDELGNQNGKAINLINIGNIYEAFGDQPAMADQRSIRNPYRQAMDYHQQGLSIATSNGFPQTRGLALINMGSIAMKTGNTIESVSNCMEAFQIAQSSGEIIRIKESCECLYKAYKKLGKADQALLYYEKFLMARDSIYSADHTRKMNRLLFEQEQSIKEVQMKADFERKNQIAREQLKRQRIGIWSLVTMIVIISVSLFFIYRLRKTTIRSNEELVKRNLELIKRDQELTFHAEEKMLEHQPEPVNFHSEQIQKASKTTLGKELQELLISRVEQLLLIEKVYLNPEINLNKLAELAGSNSSYISRIINDRYGMNFNSLINDYRIKEARKLLSEPSYNHLTIEGIAREVGFKSIPSFNNAFKKFTGLSPSYFKSASQKA